MTGYTLYQVDDDAPRDGIGEGEDTSRWFPSLAAAEQCARQRARVEVEPGFEVTVDRVVVFGSTPKRLALALLNRRHFVSSRSRALTLPGTLQRDPCVDCGEHPQIGYGDLPDLCRVCAYGDDDED